MSKVFGTRIFMAACYCMLFFLASLTPTVAATKKPAISNSNAYTPLPPSAKNTEPNTPLVPWSRFCRQLVNHQPLSNVNIQPGQQYDTNGQPVIGANLPAETNYNMPKAYRIYITAAQAQSLNIKLPDSPFADNMLLAELTVGSDGKVLYDGRPLQTEKLYAVCQSFER